jgi:hypothetical protein
MKQQWTDITLLDWTELQIEWEIEPIIWEIEPIIWRPVEITFD